MVVTPYPCEPALLPICCIRPALATHSRSHSTHTLRCAECFLTRPATQRVPGVTGWRDRPVPGAISAGAELSSTCSIGLSTSRSVSHHLPRVHAIREDSGEKGVVPT